jgi:hypothetical protein
MLNVAHNPAQAAIVPRLHAPSNAFRNFGATPLTTAASPNSLRQTLARPGSAYKECADFAVDY